MRQRALRLSLLAGSIVVAFFVLLAVYGDRAEEGGAEAKAARGDEKPGARSVAPPARLTVPPVYDTARGWEITGPAPAPAYTPTSTLAYALAGVGTATRLAHLESAGENRFRLRTLDPASGERGWEGTPTRALFAPGLAPRLLAVTAADGSAYFVTWSYGKLDATAPAPSDTIVSLDVYDATTGARRRVEVPWPAAPVVTAAGPRVLISDGKATGAVVDPATGGVSRVEPGALGRPKGCRECGRLTELRAVTEQGVLVGGAAEFWVRGGWFSRTVAPTGTAPASGVLSSVAPGRILARWQGKRKAKDTATHETWAVHDMTTGKVLARTRCRRPALAPVDAPQPALSPTGRYLIAGRLAFDLATGKGQCFEEADGTGPLTLTAVTDEGTAYGAALARSVTDALAGGGSPVEVDLTAGQPEAVALAPNVRLPGGSTAGMGLFPWTDARDRPHLTAYPLRP
ncbi:hypothetical protein OG349_25910 [Streptomyces sp. NBC_01317]|uniref:hypothetical protein n=1 Tax=Streptomyces sp. NBC_01317 TaxID=2903822 RepID=UPI002E147053|nr:hypothetical protein OG349_25910 [Streptomyces sp. NBC_01317]